MIVACGDDTGGSDQSNRDGGREDGGRNDGGPRAGTSGGGGGTSGGGDGGAVNECRNARTNDCDEHATCTDLPNGYRCECNGPAWEGDGKSCECADGYTENDDGECVAENGSECGDDDECASGHCVSGICCESACDDPDACYEAEGATCEDGETCEYPQSEDGASCDDGNACTVNDTCDDGECQAGDPRDCDDDNICTADSCDPDAANPDEACVNNGEGITTAGCREDDMCGTGYVCNGRANGQCEPAVPVACPEPSDPCEEAVCDGATGCGTRPKNEGAACEDGNQCTVGEVCQDGTCGGGSAKNCDDGNVCTTDECDPDEGCRWPYNTESCDDDNLCTSGDVCNNGSCAGVTSVTCTALDQCHTAGVCNAATGMCTNPNKPDHTACEDNNSCTSSSECQNGVCTGLGNICVGECAEEPYPCDPNANCTDPSTTTTNDFVCTCKTGFTGNGQTCTDIDECAGNPCGAGRGTCTQGPPGTYTCACMPGFKEVTTAQGKTCVCDMSGTFAFRTVSQVRWDPVLLTPTIELLEGGMGETISWGIRIQTYTADGKLSTTVRACSGTAPDICDSADFAIPMSEAYQQFEPNSFYDDNNIVAIEPTFDLPRPLGGSQFDTPLMAILLGIDLTDDYGAWPASRQDVGSMNATNGAKWVSYEENTNGVLTKVVPPGGVGTGPDGAPKAFGTTSTDCPRNDPEAARYPYRYLPNPVFGQPAITEVRTGSRLQSWLDGQFDANSCDRITGTVKGPDNGFPKFEGRFLSCKTTSGNCSDATVNALDAEPQTQEIISTSFVIERVSAGFTCQQARTHNYDP